VLDLLTIFFFALSTINARRTPEEAINLSKCQKNVTYPMKRKTPRTPKNLKN
jgi:hypothetical protein